jgi:hypothetical protein
MRRFISTTLNDHAARHVNAVPIIYQAIFREQQMQSLRLRGEL